MNPRTICINELCKKREEAQTQMSGNAEIYVVNSLHSYLNTEEVYYISPGLHDDQKKNTQVVYTLYTIRMYV